MTSYSDTKKKSLKIKHILHKHVFVQKTSLLMAEN